MAMFSRLASSSEVAVADDVSIVQPTVARSQPTQNLVETRGLTKKYGVETNSQADKRSRPTSTNNGDRLPEDMKMAAPRSGIKKIVVGVDGSEHSEAALAWATRMAKGMGSEVIAVFAISPPVDFDTGYMAPVPLPQFDPGWRAEMKKEFERDWCKGLRKAGVKYRTVFEDGHPSSVITQVADRLNADLIVVGRRGRGGVAELVLGSVSHQLVLHSKRPVLVIEAAPTKASRRLAATTRSRQPAKSKALVKATKRLTP